MPSELVAASISSAEVNDMLKHWDVGHVSEIAPMTGGSRASPKVKLTTERGTFVLKRRPIYKADAERIQFAHQVMMTVSSAGLPIALPQVARDGTTFQVQPNGIYELLLFLNGERWKRTPQQAFEAGRALATLHRGALDMLWKGNVKASCFHGNLIVVEALRRVPAAITAVYADIEQQPLHDVCQQLSHIYQQASEQVDVFGYEQISSQVVHGDWHPGNILFEGDRVSGVLDFDSTRLEPAIVDIANGLLQYSIRAGPSRAIAKWPHQLGQSLFSGFTKGFQSVDSGKIVEFVNIVPGLMIESCIAEAAIPIARLGMFATIPGDKMLGMILRRVLWIQSNTATLIQRLVTDLKH